MSIGRCGEQEIILESTTAYCRELVGERSIYRFLNEQGGQLLNDDLFADLYCETGRQSVPPRIIATVMILQRLEGLSDREAVDRFAFDARWKYACGGLPFSYPGFVHTVLVGMRARLARSERPNRIFETVLSVAREAGLLGRKRVLDSTPLYDAVATQDTFTLVRSAIRQVLSRSAPELRGAIAATLRRDDLYEERGKPACDWDDKNARNELLAALAADADATLAVLASQTDLPRDVKESGELLATIVGQDLETSPEGTIIIAKRVAKDRIISTVDPEARHGRKTSARKFDGYKGHIAIDPDTEIITATTVTAANVGDGECAAELLAEAFASPSAPPEVYGDASYGSAEVLTHVEENGGVVEVKVQGPSGNAGFFNQDDFIIDATARTVTCPAQHRVSLQVLNDSHKAYFAQRCADCPLKPQCTKSKGGRTIQLHLQFELLHRHRQRHVQPESKARYRATRPKVERKIAHLMRRTHGGRKARVRGRIKIGHDFALLAAAENIRRLAAIL